MRPSALLGTPACDGMDVNIFFPSADGRGSYNMARAICARCPVTAECLQFALDTGTDYGMFGGATPHDRRTMQWNAGTVPAFEQGHGDRKGTTTGFYREVRAGMPPCADCTQAYNESARRRLKARRARMDHDNQDAKDHNM